MTRHGGVAVIIPTVPGREADMERTTAAYEAEPDCRVFPQYGHGTVGGGWRAGVEALGDDPRWRYVLFGNDDMWPSEGWFDPAVEALEKGYAPCPVMLRPDGSVESGGSWEKRHDDWATVGWSPLPMFPLAEWPVLGDGFPAIHYWSDNWLAVSSQYRCNRPIVVRHRFEFTHTWAMPGRQYLEDANARAAGKIFQAFERDCKARWKSGEYPLINRTGATR